MNKINVISLFDGLGGTRIALDKLGYNNLNYFASEIDKYAIAVAKYNYPDIIQMGDVTRWIDWHLPEEIDLLVGGSPCQGFSFAGKQLNFHDERSRLFFRYVDILKRVRPKYFLLENVVMKQEYQDVITEYLGVEPIFINSNLVSAQSRPRLYWTNIPVELPEDRHIYLRDIVFSDVYPVALHNLYGGFNEKYPRVFEDKSPTLRTPAGGGHIPSLVRNSMEYLLEEGIGSIVTTEFKKELLGDVRDKSLCLNSSDWRGLNRNQSQNVVIELERLIHSDKAIEYMNRRVRDGRDHWDFKHHSDIRDDKSSAVVANFFKGVPYNVFKDWDCIRKFHPIECERLQTVPDDYTKLGNFDGKIKEVSNTQRYKMLGNGFTVDVIAHILENVL